MISARRRAYIKEYGELGAEVLAHFIGNVDAAREALDDCYHGAYDSEEDFAGDVFDESYPDIPEQVRWYFDEKLFARDLFVNDYYSIELDG